MPEKKKIKAIGANLLLSLGSVCFALGIAEIGLQIAGVSYPSFYQVDPHRGHALIPNYSAWWINEGKGYVAINRDGLRDGEHSVAKPENTFRIAILGDSFSEAIQVNADETFWSAIEKQLPTCAALQGKQVEVINFGVGDYGTAQELMTLKHHVWKYQPDLVLLEIFTGNDIVNNSQALSPSDRFSPFLKKQGDQFVMDLSFKDTETYRRRDSFARRFVFNLINHSRVLQVINEAKRVIGTRQTMGQRQTGQAKPDDLIPALDFDVNLYQEPTNKDWQEAWEVTEELVKQINNEVKTKGANFVALTISNPPQVYPDLQVRERLKELGAKNLFYPDQRIQQLGQVNGFTVFNLAPEMQTYADQNQVHLHGFENTRLGVGHWNRKGHAVAGKLITDKLCQKFNQFNQ
ncbi:MAG: SGNH/GDSL hydrolase family protein [Snowella sp.]|nr:SGNH/GDSL hydrolase family protein [Snowella sp.]